MQQQQDQSVDPSRRRGVSPHRRSQNGTSVQHSQRDVNAVESPSEEETDWTVYNPPAQSTAEPPSADHEIPEEVQELLELMNETTSCWVFIRRHCPSDKVALGFLQVLNAMSRSSPCVATTGGAAASSAASTATAEESRARKSRPRAQTPRRTALPRDEPAAASESQLPAAALRSTKAATCT